MGGGRPPLYRFEEKYKLLLKGVDNRKIMTTFNRLLSLLGIILCQIWPWS